MVNHCLFIYSRKVEDNPGLKEYIEKEGIVISATEKELNGPKRYAADNLMSQEECEQLIRLTNVSHICCTNICYVLC